MELPTLEDITFIPIFDLDLREIVNEKYQKTNYRKKFYRSTGKQKSRESMWTLNDLVLEVILEQNFCT